MTKRKGSAPLLHLRAAVAAGSLIRALNAQHALKRKRGPKDIEAYRRMRADVDALAEKYLRALRDYVEFLQRAVDGED